MNDDIGVRDALEMGCQVTLEIGELKVTYTPPEEEHSVNVMNFNIDGSDMFPDMFATVGDEPEPVEADVKMSASWDEEDGIRSVRCDATFEGCAIEEEGIGKNRLIITYGESRTADVITQLLSVVEAITDAAHDAGVVPTDFEGLLRGMVDEFDELDAEEASD